MLVCKQCGGSNVCVQAWVNINTNEYIDEFDPKSQYCDDCSESTTTVLSQLAIGDKVEITGNIPHQLKDKSRPLLGRITGIDGYYILVKPLWQKYTCEFYPNELKKVA